MDDFEQRVKKAFGLVAFTCNRHLIDHMRRVSNDLGIDLDTAMLWGLTAHLNVAPSIRPGAPPSEVMSVQGEFTGQRHPVKLADVAFVSGLPRETVRRKLELLRAAGKLEKTADGGWAVLSSGVDEATFNFTVDSIRRLLATARQIETILAQVEPD